MSSLSRTPCSLIQSCCFKYFLIGQQFPSISQISSIDLSLELQMSTAASCFKPTIGYLAGISTGCVPTESTWSSHQTELPMSVNANYCTSFWLLGPKPQSHPVAICLLQTSHSTSWANLVASLLTIDPESDHFSLLSNQHHRSPWLLQWLPNPPLPHPVYSQHSLHTKWFTCKKRQIGSLFTFLE